MIVKSDSSLPCGLICLCNSYDLLCWIIKFFLYFNEFLGTGAGAGDNFLAPLIFETRQGRVLRFRNEGGISKYGPLVMPTQKRFGKKKNNECES